MFGVTTKHMVRVFRQRTEGRAFDFKLSYSYCNIIIHTEYLNFPF